MRLHIPLAAMAILALVTISARAAEKQWQTGTWTKVDVSRQIVDFGPGASGFGRPNQAPSMRAMADIRVYVIEGKAVRLELKDVVQVGRRSVDAVVGEPVSFAIEKNTVYIRDMDGTQHKLRITKKTAK